MSALRSQVISLYRRSLQLARSWQAASGKETDTAAERKYISEEARRLFRKNKNLKSKEDISRHILEAEARLELAVHYKNPYPRPVHLPQWEAVSSASNLSTVKRKIKESHPTYASSYFDNDTKS